MLFKPGFYEAENNYSKDILSQRALFFAKLWAYFMEIEIKKGRFIEEKMVKETRDETAEIIDITPTTLNTAKNILVNYWLYGEEVNVIFHKER